MHEQLAQHLRSSLPKGHPPTFRGTRRNFWETRGRGWEKVACWSIKVAISLKRVKIEEKLLWRAYRKSPTLLRVFGSPPYFYFRFRVYGHRNGRFCRVFARTAQQSVLDGTTELSSSKPCAYCRIVRSGASRGNLCDSTAFLFSFVIMHLLLEQVGQIMMKTTKI